MPKAKWYYIVRKEDQVLVTDKKPKGLELSTREATWYLFVKSFGFPIGCPDPYCFLSVDGWRGPIGVFNIRNREHVLNAICLIKNHEISICWRLLNHKLESAGVRLRIPAKYPTSFVRFDLTNIGQIVHDAFMTLLPIHIKRDAFRLPRMRTKKTSPLWRKVKFSCRKLSS